jgi:DNA-binding transcriptional MerR regulator
VKQQGLMTIGQLAAAVGKTPRALRLYEEKGLIAPATRSDGGFRLYDVNALTRLRWILEWVETGLPLQDIQGMLRDVATSETGGAAMDGLRARYSERLTELDAQLQRLTRLRAAVVSGLNYMERCRTCTRTVLPDCCGRCVAQVDHLPPMMAGLYAQARDDRRTHNQQDDRIQVEG